MAYLEASKQPAPNSLMSDTERLNGRLRETLLRIEKIGDTLHGALPRDATATPGAPMGSSVRRSVDVAHDTMNEIESELTRVETRL